MKAVVLRKLVDSPRELNVETLEDPKCPDDGFLVEVRAIGVNFFDMLQISGKLNRTWFRHMLTIGHFGWQGSTSSGLNSWVNRETRWTGY
jgi:NADPH:quinone reductase-like Zn-dependent oxidoreductase